MELSEQMFGYFDEAGQTEPTYRPGPETPCVACGEKIEGQRFSTSFMVPGDWRCYFHYTHKDCSRDMEAVAAAEGWMIDHRAAAMSAAGTPEKVIRATPDGEIFFAPKST